MLKCKDELSVMFDAFSLQNVLISKYLNIMNCVGLPPFVEVNLRKKQANLLFKTLLLLITFGSAY